MKNHTHSYSWRSLLRPATFALIATAAAVNARAAGFALLEQNASGLGQAYSNAAAVEDASTVFFNPAGMVHLSPDTDHVVVATNFIRFQSEFTNNGTTNPLNAPIAGGNGGDLGSIGVVPNLYWVTNINEKWAVGVGVNSPWGLVTEYEDGWVGRYSALRSEMKTVLISPSIAYKVNDQFSIGVSLGVQRVQAELSNAVDFGLVAFGPAGTGLADGKVVVEANDIDIGFDIGLLYEISKGTRIGFNYRSGYDYQLSGTATFSGVPGGLAPVFTPGVAQPVTSQITLPRTMSLHFAKDLNEKLQLTADITHWDFSKFQELVVDYVNPLIPNTVLTQNWKDSYFYAVGTRYKLDDAIALKFGAAYNTTPVQSAEFRTPRLPDSSRRWLAMGVDWKIKDGTTLHLGYTHLWFDDATTAYNDGQNHITRGSYDSMVDILSIQGTFEF